jgi:DNA-binding transcriptional regulator YiaG
MNGELFSRSRARRRFRPALARAVRTEAQLSQAELAAAIDVNGSTISRWENGNRQPRGSAAVRYQDLLSRLESEMRRG